MMAKMRTMHPGRAVLLAALLGLPLAAARAQAAPCELSLRWADDAPYSMRTREGQIVGINVDFVREALRRMGCTMRLVEMPWARALAELEAGRLDVLAGAFRRPERERYAYFAAARFRSRNMLFAHVDALRKMPLTRLSELAGSGFRLGAQIGVSYGPEYVELMRNAAFAKTVTLASGRHNLWLMVSLRRIDGIIANEATARHELAQLGLQEQIRMSPVVVSDEAATVAFSKKAVEPAFVERFDAATESMQKDGTVAAILQRYLGAP